jgi:hypothetical protein
MGEERLNRSCAGSSGKISSDIAWLILRNPSLWPSHRNASHHPCTHGYENEEEKLQAPCPDGRNVKRGIACQHIVL